MSKKLFIFLFLLIALPVFADDNPFRDEVINELPPELPSVQQISWFVSSKVGHLIQKLLLRLVKLYHLT